MLGPLLLAACAAKPPPPTTSVERCAANEPATDAGMPVELGAKPGAPVIAVNIDADGRAYVNGTAAFKPEDFSAAVAKVKGQSELAVIAADAHVPHGRVVAVMDELMRAGVRKIAFAVQPSAAPPAEPPPTAPPPPPPSASAEPPAAPPAEPAQPLPEVKVEAVGLHIGGGPNDEATKAPFLHAIEQHFDELRACYVKAEDPEKGGTYGVDFNIGKGGGKAKLEQPRTGMKGPEFRKCVLGVFENVEFEKPKKGATVISYSVRFRLAK
jgi:biopolymer transport protein ExbD